MGNVVKNLSATAAVIGLAFSFAGNSSIVVSGNYEVPNYELFVDAPGNSENSSIVGYSQNNIYILIKNAHDLKEWQKNLLEE